MASTHNPLISAEELNDRRADRLRRDAVTKAVSLVLKRLEKPSGIAMDAAGNLYFTELPTPGKSAAQGGRNRIWKYDPRTHRGRGCVLDPGAGRLATTRPGRGGWLCGERELRDHGK